MDGEELGIDTVLIDAHVRRCAGCRDFESRVSEVRRRTRVQPAPIIPDVSRRVTKVAAITEAASRWSIVRGLLAVVAVEIIVFAVPDLVPVDEAGAAAHAARHLGAFTVAYGVGLLVVVIRPARARTMLPVASVLAGALVITAVVDLWNHNVPFAGEAQHLPEIVSVVLIWLLAVPSRRRAERIGRRHDAGFGTLSAAPDPPADRRVG